MLEHRVDSTPLWATRAAVRQSKELAVQRGDTEHAEFWVTIRFGGTGFGTRELRSAEVHSLAEQCRLALDSLPDF